MHSLLRKRAAEQLAIDFNCASDDFFSDNNKITLSAANSGRRIYSFDPFFFSMASMGRGAVISADESIHKELSEVIGGEGFRLFEFSNSDKINRVLLKHGYRLGNALRYCLPATLDIVTIPEIAPVKWYELGEMDELYLSQLYPNALCYTAACPCPDMLAVAAMDGDNIMGLAGVGADSEDFWQIGIDIMPGYRGKELGVYLVGMLRNEVIRRGKIPFYSSAVSHILSQTIAQENGFLPAWTECQCEKCEKNDS